MKELLNKFFGLFSEGIKNLEENDTSEALKKLKEASNLSIEVTEKAENFESEKLQKFFDSEKWKEVLEKYAEVFISAFDAKELREEIKTMSENIENLTKDFKEIKKEKEADDIVISEALEKTLDRLETIETGLVSKIEE